MTEMDGPSEAKTYLDSVRELIKDIGKNVDDLIAVNSRAFIVDAALSSDDGVTSFAELPPELEDEEYMAQLILTDIWVASKSFQIQEFLSFAASLDDEMLAGTCSPDEARAKLEEFQPTLPTTAQGNYAAYAGEDEDTEVSLSSVTLNNESSPGYAKMVKITYSDGLIEKEFSFSFHNGEPKAPQVDFRPVEDELLERAVTMLADEDMDRAVELLAGGGLEEPDVDAILNEIWLNYQGSSKEQQVGPLLDEVRDRYNAARHSRLLNQELKSNRPTFGTLNDILEELKSF